MPGKDACLNRKRLLIGLAVALVGVVVARGNQWLLGIDSPYLFVAYALGVAIGLGGLVIIGSSLGKTYVKVEQCPECLTLNPSALVSAADLKRSGWGTSDGVTDHALHEQMRHLREPLRSTASKED